MKPLSFIAQPINKTPLFLARTESKPIGFQKISSVSATDQVLFSGQKENKKRSYILVFDHGTTGIRACLMDKKGDFVAKGYQDFKQIYPEKGWVEHNANTLWKKSLKMTDKAFKEAGATWNDVEAIGITNQRETVVMWDSKTGKPLHNAIVWQCQRTADDCAKLKEQEGFEDDVHERTGLYVDPYFSATKIKWLMEHEPNAKKLMDKGRLRVGTVDTWILWNLSGGESYVTDISNASRMMLFNLKSQDWDDKLLKTFGIERSILPKIVESSSVFGKTDAELTGGRAIPLAGDAGDQQSALYGHKAWNAGEVKSTYGTGAFLLMNLGDEPKLSEHNLLTTAAINAEGKAANALEGSIFMAGAVLEWLRKQMGLIDAPAEASELAESIESTEGVYFVPAFTGLGAPYWDANAKGTIVGMTQDTGRAHVVRAGLEAIAYQTRDVLDAMEADAGRPIESLRVDGGVTRSDFLMQFLADILNIPVLRDTESDITARGAGFLAGKAVGFWDSADEIKALADEQEAFTPNMDSKTREQLYNGWKQAVEQTRHTG